MDNLNQDLTSLLRRAGLDNSGGEWGSRILLVAGIVLICYLAVKLFRHLVIPALQRISAQTRTMWDDHLFDDKVLHAACRLIPPVLLYLLLPLAFGDDPSLLKLLHKGCSIYLIVVTIALLNTFLSALYDISNKHETLRDRPLKGIYQMLKLVTVSVGIVLIIGILIDRNATSILAGLGASAAVLMLIFKDSILGLVAGVQLSANDMLRPGDWITMSKYGADGYVIEVTLTTVKVQNFDKTITTIPPYALVSDSFQNWRGMRECGGRRIKRSVFIDARTIHRRTPEETARLREKGYLAADTSQEIVNLQALREYLANYLRNCPDVRSDLMLMVRTLQPTSEGVPLEFYCFTRHFEWIPYEAFQSALTDRVLTLLAGVRLAGVPAALTAFGHRRNVCFPTQNARFLPEGAYPCNGFSGKGARNTTKYALPACVPAVARRERPRKTARRRTARAERRLHPIGYYASALRHMLT